MTITLNWQTIISISAILVALVTIYRHFSGIVHFIDRQKEQDVEIKNIKKEMDNEFKQLRDEFNNIIADIRQEQQMLTYGILACLKGLKEQGCDGPVTEAVNKIEKHLNELAHR